MIFFDASAVVKAFTVEHGSPLVHASIARMQGRLYLTSAVALEVLGTLAKKRRADMLTQAEYRAARAKFLQSLGGALNLLDVHLADFTAGYELVDRHRQIGAGAMDVLHIVSALRLQAANQGQSLVVASSDHGFRSLAHAVGLRTFDPETANLATLLDLTRSTTN
jgi:predicted nucleic acid-binding protein